jgi:hypothetical protein
MRWKAERVVQRIAFGQLWRHPSRSSRALYSAEDVTAQQHGWFAVYTDLIIKMRKAMPIILSLPPVETTRFPQSPCWALSIETYHP